MFFEGGWCLLRIRYCWLECEREKQQQLNSRGKSSTQLKQGTFVGVFFPLDVNFEGHMVFKGLEWHRSCVDDYAQSLDDYKFKL